MRSLSSPHQPDATSTRQVDTTHTKMCGIVAAFLAGQDADARAKLRPAALRMAKRIRHRGPDWSGVYCQGGAVIAHERLAIMHPESGAQPITRDGVLALGVNGEIFNYREIRRAAGLCEDTATSDCEVIVDLHASRGGAAGAESWLRELSGMFAFALHDQATGDFVVARDHIGIIPLYFGTDADGALWVASELKAIHDRCPDACQFPPGHVLVVGAGDAPASPVRWYRPQFYESPTPPVAPLDLPRLRSEFERAVSRQLMSDVPDRTAVLLSGGLDSSLVAALAAREYGRRGYRLHTFSVGLEGSPDLAAARDVAAHIGSEHHEVVFTVQEGLDAVRDVVYHLETYDVTTIRAGTPMYLLSRAMKALGFKCCLSGEGSDEIFGGYLYFHKAPSAAELHAETVRKLRDLHKYDCLRANKCTAAWGIEARVPFLDRDFLAYAMSLDPASKMCHHPDGRPRVEKWALRAAFDGDDALLPQAVLWRQKEQFSDGVGFSWIDELRRAAAAEFPRGKDDLAAAAERWTYGPPRTLEALMHRAAFDELFPGEGAARTVPCGDTIACSSAAATGWDASFKGMLDPSGRAVKGVHAHAYD